MHMSSIYNGHVHRCAHQMRRLRTELLTRARQRGHATEAKEEANKLGVILEFDNPWHISKPEEWSLDQILQKTTFTDVFPKSLCMAWTRD